jgi:TetR/AcrR family transcriptional repressor of bet genes
MARPAEKMTRKRRNASRQERREQLIRATIRTVARKGLSEVTIGNVARQAKLSQGIINLHFQSKDRLLLETLRYVADEYRATWDAAIRQSDLDSAGRLARIIEVDFDPKVCDRNKLAVWFAFWGESKSRPTYLKICAERDRQYHQMMTGLCAELVKDGGYTDVDPVAIATGLYAMTEGLWLQLLVNPDSIDPTQAKGVLFTFLARVFPRHFQATGLLENRP